MGAGRLNRLARAAAALAACSLSQGATPDGHVSQAGLERIRQPPIYIMVGLWGRLCADWRRFSGIVPECAAPFSLVRQ